MFSAAAPGSVTVGVVVGGVAGVLAVSTLPVGAGSFLSFRWVGPVPLDLLEPLLPPPPPRRGLGGESPFTVAGEAGIVRDGK